MLKFPQDDVGKVETCRSFGELYVDLHIYKVQIAVYTESIILLMSSKTARNMQRPIIEIN